MVECAIKGATAQTDCEDLLIENGDKRGDCPNEPRKRPTGISQGNSRPTMPS